MSSSFENAPSDATLYSLDGSLERTRLSWTYRAGLVVVALAMLMLPLLYLALIGIAGSAVWWHLTANTWIMSGSGQVVWRLLAYLGPVVAGCVLLFFMVKPVLARPARRVDPVDIRPDAEPELFRFVTRICELVRAPVPARIQVNCQVNASAAFSSMLALLRPRFVLTIGLPLAAGLTVRQLGGVLAHEFGHFAQGGGMRLTYVVRSINGWFARVVLERDEWDEKLERSTKGADWRIYFVLALAKASIWCSRRILYGLMMAGHAISCFMMRQMEYDADSYEIKLAGSAAFIETSARMRELNVGAQIGYHELHEGWVRRTLPSNLPEFLLNGCSRLSEELSKQIRQIPEGKTGVFDTHPADADRVRAAERAQAKGLLVSGDVPASRLFRNFEALSAAATRHHYEHDLELRLDTATLIDTHVAVAASVSRLERFASTQTFFGEQVSDCRPVEPRLPGVESLTASELIEKMLDGRRIMSSDGGQRTAAYREFEEIEGKLALAQTARLLFDAGFTKVVPADFELAQGTKEGASEAVASAEMKLRRLEPAVRRLDDLAAARLACAVALLERTPLDIDPQTCEALRQEAARLTPQLRALAAVWPQVQEVRRLLFAEQTVSGNAAQSPDPAAATAKTAAIVDRMRFLLGQVRASIGDTAATDDDLHQPARLAALLGLESTADTEEKAAVAVNAAVSLRKDLIGRLCAVALQIEAAADRCGAEPTLAPTERPSAAPENG